MKAPKKIDQAIGRLRERHSRVARYYQISCKNAALREILGSHCYATTELPTISGEVHRVRKPGRPEPIHRQIYNHLGIDLSLLPTQRSCYRQPG